MRLIDEFYLSKSRVIVDDSSFGILRDAIPQLMTEAPKKRPDEDPAS
jgi:hypothetical protein